MARLAQVIKKLNIGLSTAVEFLNKKGEQLENNPNTKLTDEQEALLVKEFSTAETVKLEADRLNHLRQEKEKVVEEAPAVEKVEEVKIEIERPHFKPVAKIDLDSIGKPKAKAEEPKVEEVVAPKPAPVEPKPAPVVVVPEPVKEKVVITPKPVEVKQPEVVKPEPVEVPTTPSNDVFTLRKVEVENHIKMVGKIDLDAINNSTRPAKKSKEEKRRERIDKERVEFQKKKPIVKAPATDAATVVPKKSNMPNLVLKADLNSEDAKKKRKRIGGNEQIGRAHV